MRSSRRPRLRSLRAKAIGVVVAVVLSPIAFIFGYNAIETSFEDRTLALALDTASRVARDLPAAREIAEARAHRHHQLVRVVAGRELLFEVDALNDSTLGVRLGDLFYGPDRAPSLRAFAEAPRRDPAAESCVHLTRGNLYVCQAVAQAELADGRRAQVVVLGWSRRAFQALYELRRQLSKLTLFLLLFGLLLAWWIGRRMVRPMETLRDEVLARARAAVPKADIEMRRRDEVGDLAAAFNTLLGALGERTRANEAFLADLAHEFKNPVAAVRAVAESLEGAENPERRARLAAILADSSRRLDALVTQFLELAKAEAGLPNEPREEVDLAALLRGLAEATSRVEKHPELRVALDRPLRVSGVPHRLESAFRNLLDNAASFAGEHGHVEIAARAEGGFIEATIADSGPGIAEKDLPRLFDRFFTTRGDRQGTGLGLALTRAVVEAHGGAIRVESPPGSGARFVVRLPFTDDSQRAR